MGFSQILTQQSSRLIFLLASQAGNEPTAVHRPQDLERDGIALLISPSERGECLGVAVPAKLQNTNNGKGEEGRRARWIPPRGAPSEGGHIGRRWSPLLATV